MSSAYTFFSWARKGIANRIDGAPANAPRATVSVALEASAQTLIGGTTRTPVAPVPVQLYSPADVVGIDVRVEAGRISGAIFRTDPRPDGVTSFEPNCLAAVDFIDEDFPWRYTPAPPDANGRLVPWIALVVLQDGSECQFKPKEGEEQLDTITILGQGGNAFPEPQTLWAWAHVHVDAGIAGTSGRVTTGLANELRARAEGDADVAYSRVLCPRRLAPDTVYRACLIPSFETGRLAGLGLPVGATTPAMPTSWPVGGPVAQTAFPVYFSWTFRTAKLGDFEYLARLLKPKPVDRSVGVRPLDASQPHPMLAGIGGPSQGVLALGGALRAARSQMSAAERAAVEANETWVSPQAFQRDLASLINLADLYQATPAAQANNSVPLVRDVADDDPVITPPLYGRWHAQTARLLTGRNGAPVPNTDNWVHELNLDPRHRSAAGFGVRVVQTQQEDLMKAAWEQLGDVLKANARMRLMKAGQAVAQVWQSNIFVSMSTADPARVLMLTAPLHSRVMAASGSSAMTMRTQAAASSAAGVLLSPGWRRAIRPRARMGRIAKLDTAGSSGAILSRVDRGELELAPPKTTPLGVATINALADKAVERAVGSLWLGRLLLRAPWIVALPLLLAFLIAFLFWLFGFGAIAAIAVLVLGAAASLFLYQRLRAAVSAAGISEAGQGSAAVVELSDSPDFTWASPGAAPPLTLTDNGVDSPEASRFKTGLADIAVLLEASVAADAVGENGPVRAPLGLVAAAETTVAALDPQRTFPLRGRGIVHVPPRIAGQAAEPEVFDEVKAYPVFDMPMYQPLAALSSELLVPNINKVESNSVTLLETNQKFIESYMVGLNHEFGRELLWREYPTDQRGSYFRQFWDVSSVLATGTGDPEARKESLRDIPPLHLWSRSSKLGAHDARELAGTKKEEAVLVIRGELLRRYPNVVVYAQAADWARDEHNKVDLAKPRVLRPLADENNPARDVLRTPLYGAKLEPDITMLGFDLTLDEARGGDLATDAAGWFFVIKERPGEPRFGFDETSAAPADQLGVWNDLGWDLVLEAGASCIKPLRNQPLRINPATVPQTQQDQHDEDARLEWNSGVNSDALAYILYQAPVRIAVHASEMLGRPGA